MRFWLHAFVACFLFIFSLSCASFPGFSGSAYLFGNFKIEKPLGVSDYHYLFAFRDGRSSEEFIYDLEELIVFECSESADSFKAIKVKPGKYRICSLIRLSENETAFLTYDKGVVFETDLKSTDFVEVKSGEALYLGDYHITIKEKDGLIGVSWTISDSKSHDVEMLRSFGKSFADLRILSLFEVK